MYHKPASFSIERGRNVLQIGGDIFSVVGKNGMLDIRNLKRKGVNSLEFVQYLTEELRQHGERLRADRKTNAKLSEELQRAIDLVHSCQELEDFVHFWWLQHKNEMSSVQMEWALRLMYSHFRENHSIL